MFSGEIEMQVRETTSETTFWFAQNSVFFCMLNNVHKIDSSICVFLVGCYGNYKNASFFVMMITATQGENSSINLS